jgi:hypothetical protein
MVEMSSIKKERVRFHNYSTSLCGLVRKNLLKQFSKRKVQSKEVRIDRAWLLGGTNNSSELSRGKDVK